MSDGITKQAVVILLQRKHMGTNKTLKSAAKKLNVTPTYLSRVLRGLQDPSSMMLDTIGIERVKIYRRKE